MFDWMSCILVATASIKRCGLDIDLIGTYVKNEEKTSTTKTTCLKPPYDLGTLEDGAVTTRMSNSTRSPQRCN